MVVNVPSVAVNVTLGLDVSLLFEDTLPCSVMFPVDEMERSPFPAVAEFTVSAMLLSRNTPSPADAVKVRVPGEEVSRGLLDVPIPAVAVSMSVLAYTVEPFSSTMAPPVASRVTVPVVATLSGVPLLSLLKSISPDELTSMLPFDAEALRVIVFAPEEVFWI